VVSRFAPLRSRVTTGKSVLADHVVVNKGEGERTLALLSYRTSLFSFEYSRRFFGVWLAQEACLLLRP
jgi:hypothetical protein